MPTTVMNDINVATFKYIKACSSQKPARNLTLTKRYIKENDLVAVPFDKGVGVCLMRRESYTKKMADILKLSQFEKWVKPRANSKDLIEKEEERINDELTKLLGDGEISSQLRDDLKSQGGQPPQLYGLAKVHNTSVPMRLVMSMPGSPYYSIAAKVTEWLSVVPQSKCQSSSKKIADQLKAIELDKGEVLVSFDVVSLYTNVPVQEAILDAAERLYCGEFEKPPVSKDTFIKVMQLAPTDVAMLTHDGYYVQKDGLAMGSPPAPLLANIWLAKKEPEIKDGAKHFERYMDDIIRTIRSEQIDVKLYEINQLHT